MSVASQNRPPAARPLVRAGARSAILPFFALSTPRQLTGWRSPMAHSAARRIAGLAARTVFSDGYRQTVRIQVLSNASPEDILRLFNAADTPLDHAPVEGIEIGNAEAWTAPSRWQFLRVVVLGPRPLAQVQREGRLTG